MLRKLLNDDDKNFRKSSQPQDILQQLLKDNSDTQGSPSSYPSTPVSTLPNNFSELMSPQSARFSGPASNKRKSVDESGSGQGSQPTTPSPMESYKRPATAPKPSQQLAGQNPMLASMLAQTPKTLPVPTIQIPTSIVSQVPQERLPKNLEKKLVHAPTGPDGMVLVSSQGAMGGIVSPGQQFMLPSQQPPLRSPNIPPGMGPVSHHRFQVQTQMEGSSILNQQGYLNKMLVDSNAVNNNTIRSQVVTAGPSSGLYPSGHQHVSGPPQRLPANLAFQDEQQNDPILSDILEQVWSLQQEMDVTSEVPSHSVNPPPSVVHHHGNPAMSQQASHDDMLLKILDEVLEPTNPAIATPSTPGSVVATPATPTADMNEKLRISEIQRQLMSCEASSPQHIQQRPQMFPLGPPGPTGPFANFSQHHQGPPPAYPMGQAQGQLQRRTVAPQVMQHRPQQYPVSGPIHPVMNQQQPLSPAAFAPNMPPQPRGKGAKNRPQLQNQKRNQPMMSGMGEQSPGIGGHDLNELLNKTVAPNVSLPLKPRFPLTGSNSPIPQQLSPGQRSISGGPFSPHTMQPYQNTGQQQGSNYAPPNQQHSMSPHGGYSNVSSPHAGPNSPAQMHMQSSQGNFAPSQPTGNWSSTGPRPQTQNRIQAQNPMLNAQLGGGGGATGPSQVRYTARPMGSNATGMSPGPRNSPIPQFPSSPGQFQGQQPPTPQPGGPNSRLIQLNPQTQPLIQGSQVRVRGTSPRVMNDSPFSSSFGHGTPVQIEARSPGQFIPSSPSVSATSQVISSEVRQKIQAHVGARQTQQHLQHQQSNQVHMMPTSSPSTSSLPVMSSNSAFTQADLDAMEFGLSLDLEPSGLGFGTSSGDSLTLHSVFDDPFSSIATSSPASTPAMNTPSSSGVHLMRTQSVNSPRMVSLFS